MLLQSGLPKGMWWKAYAAARYVALRLPTNTCQGYMSPMECVPEGFVPTHKWFRVWKCKAFVLVNRADRRKDWQEKVNTGYFVEYSEDTKGWGVNIPSTDPVVFSAYVLFDEKVSNRQTDNFREIDEMAVKFAPDEKRLEEYEYLVKTLII